VRVLAKISIPVEAGNEAIKNGSLPRVMKKAMEDLKPEAAYFLAENGERTAILVFDLTAESKIPWTVERFFMGFNADVTITPVMNAADLEKGIPEAMAAL